MLGKRRETSCATGERLDGLKSCIKLVCKGRRTAQVSGSLQPAPACRLNCPLQASRGDLPRPSPTRPQVSMRSVGGHGSCCRLRRGSGRGLERTGPSKMPVWARRCCCCHDVPELRRARIALHKRAQPARHRIRAPFAPAASSIRVHAPDIERTMCRVVRDRRPRESIARRTLVVQFDIDAYDSATI